MSENYKKISRAITALTTSAQNSTPPTGDVAEMVAKKAKVSRATLYRHLAKYPDLQTSYDSLKGPTLRVSRGDSLKVANSDDALKTIENLKKEVSALKQERDQISQTKNAQIILLWNECKRLREQINDPGENSGDNVVPMPKKRE
ncbi:hypothetical protein ACTJKJ_24545 [Roseateles sp. 22389]|uniref:hypothetical protein n=1 Tax=Roseateles sp. 22389 TaxID=3453916 RepID=UPI003F862A86